ncbi:MAG: flagellar motor protein [Aliifodinibius sp.]|nr:flagellar motor protein [Fodinibius sp.]NIW47167.1 flagellar motor protein [Gammaproteobacteria bacterium]NIY28298.1 flagellar motor protein [Fodinibius sp.]
MKKALDFATLLGLFVGTAAILGSIMTAGGLSGFINVPSFLIVIGGTIAAVLIQYPLNDVLKIVGVARQIIQHNSNDPTELIEMIVKFAEKARRDGLLALENHIKEIDDGFIKSGLQLAIDGTEPELLNDILDTEISNLEERHKKGHGIFDAFGTYAPAFGMIGTLIGLVFMLQSMEDPASIGPSMAVALVTTFYGAVMSNFVFLPIAGKLKERTKDEVQNREMIIAGILSIQSGDNPRLVRQKLMTFLPPNNRKNDEM